MAKSARRKVNKKASRNSRVRLDKNKRIRLLVKENPRRAGTTAHKRFGSLLKATRTKRNATAGEVMKVSGYRGDDLRWDIEAGNVKLVG